MNKEEREYSVRIEFYVTVVAEDEFDAEDAAAELAVNEHNLQPHTFDIGEVIEI